MKDLKQLITKNFPYEKFNPGQFEAIEFVVNEFRAGKKHVILQAPTGIGKSAIATTIHRVLKELEKDWRTTIITSTKGLQDQYEKEDSQIFSLKGKTNYSCPLGRDHYTGKGCTVARSEGICETPNQVCTYLIRRDKWCNVESLRLTNSSFQIKAAEGLVMEDENKANLIIVDECHDIDEQLVEHNSFNLDVESLQHIVNHTSAKLLSDIVDFVNIFSDYKEGDAFKISKDISVLGKTILDQLESNLKKIESDLEKNKKNLGLVAASDTVKSLVEQFSMFVLQNGEWLVEEYAFSQKVYIKPIYAYQVSDKALFRKAEHFLHMSATICGYESYIFSLGIKKEESSYLELSNPIPVENRLINVMPVMKVSGDFDRHRLAALVDKVISRHSGENGVIHTVSFALAKDILENSAFKKNMVISNDRSEILDILTKQKGKIVLSPSIEKGYDFKDDMCRFQIIAKIPYYYLGSKWVALNTQRDNRWYARKAILRLVQASGRAVRGVNDYAKTYLFDSNFDMLYKRNKDLFPDWYIDSLVVKK